MFHVDKMTCAYLLQNTPMHVGIDHLFPTQWESYLSIGQHGEMTLNWFLIGASSSQAHTDHLSGDM